MPGNDFWLTKDYGPIIKKHPLEITAKGMAFHNNYYPKKYCILNHFSYTESHKNIQVVRGAGSMSQGSQLHFNWREKKFLFPFLSFCTDKALRNCKTGTSWLSHSHIRSKMYAVPVLDCTSISSTPEKELRNADLHFSSLGHCYGFLMRNLYKLKITFSSNTTIVILRKSN